MPALYSKDDEEKAPDFRSRYAAETAGMPANLAAIASKNLAAQDASLDKINAVQRYNSALPGVGTPGSTPQTDAANLSMANAMDRADLGNRFGFDSPQYTQGTDTPTIADLHTDDIAQRRAAIDEQRKQIQARLGIIQPREAGLAAVVLAGPKERKDLLQNLNFVEQQDQSLLREHHLNAIDSAKTAHETFARESHALAAKDFADLSSELLNVRKTYKPGTPEYATATLEAVSKHPDGFSIQAGQTLVRAMTAPHDKAAATAESIKKAIDDFRTATGAEPESLEVTSTGGINLRAGSTSRAKEKPDKLTAIVENDLAKTGVTPDEFTQRSNIRRGRIKEGGEFSNNYSGAEKGGHVAFEVNGKTYTMPFEDFSRADKVHPMTDAAASPAAAAVPAATPSASAAATPAKRFVFNPVTKKLEPAKE